MQYVPGFALYDWIDQRAKQLCKSASTHDGLKATEAPAILPLSRVKYAAKRLFFALRAIHRAGIAHNDLDTSNIRITNPEGPGRLRVTIVDLNGAKMDDDSVPSAMEDDIIRLTMSVLELGMSPQPRDMPRLSLDECSSEHFGGALISIPRWVEGTKKNSAIARHVLKMSQDCTSTAIVAYPEVLSFVGHIIKLDEERRLTWKNIFRHPFLRKG